MDWRTRWAERENARRRTAYESAITRWSVVAAELRAMVEAARRFDGLRPQESPPWLDLRRDERLLWLGADAQLVEAPAWPPLAHPGYANLTIDQLIGPFGNAVPVTLQAADRGPVAVTDKRVVLAGRRRREWVYAKLAGLGHLPNTPCTLMFVINRAKVSGVVLDPAVAAHFRFNLALGLAGGAGDRPGFVAHLERHVAWHQGIRPLPAGLIGPTEAPAPARLVFDTVKSWVIGPVGSSPGRRVAHLATTFVVLLVLLALLTPGDGGNEQNTALSSDAAPTAATTEQQPEPSAAAESPTATPVTTPRPKATPTAIPTPTAKSRTSRPAEKKPASTKSKPEPKPKPKPKPKPEPKPACDPNYSGACVPIADDVDCAGGSGDGPAYVDGPVYVEGEDVYDLDQDGDGIGCDT